MEIKLKNPFFFYKDKLLIMAMKSFIFLFCSMVFGFTPANEVFSQNTKIKIENDKVLTVDEVFELISDQTDYTFIYQVDTIWYTNYHNHRWYEPGKQGNVVAKQHERSQYPGNDDRDNNHREDHRSPRSEKQQHDKGCNQRRKDEEHLQLIFNLTGNH